MNQEIATILQYFDLDESEIQVYVTLLKLGRATAYQVAKASGLKRPTVYVLVERLAHKGVVTVESGATSLISPVPPKQLVAIWKSRVASLESLQPQLDALLHKSQYQPRVQVFEGEAGVDAVYRELPPADSQGEEILLFGSMGAILNGFKYLLPKWEQSFGNKKNPIRELLNDEPENAEYIDYQTNLKNPNYQIRVMQDNVFGKTDNIIFRNKLAIFSLDTELFVTIIESAEIARTYCALFDAAWQTARPASKQ